MSKTIATKNWIKPNEVQSALLKEYERTMDTYWRFNTFPGTQDMADACRRHADWILNYFRNRWDLTIFAHETALGCTGYHLGKYVR